MRIAIVGGGITGLTTALALRKVGFEPMVYEQAPELAPLGAGIWIAPNALRILDWLGLGDLVRQAGQPLDQVAITDQQLGPLRRSRQAYVSTTDGIPLISIHRARLQNILKAALPEERVWLGQAYQQHQEQGGAVTVELSDKTTQADLLLGADGLRSGVREAIFPSAPLRYAGQTCWRGIASYALPASLQASGYEAWGPGLRFGFSAVSDGEVYWFAVAKAAQGESEPNEGRQDRLCARFQAFHPLVGEMIKATPKILRHDLLDLARLPAWSQGRVALLGDAAHATTPNMGQGAAQGIEDAFSLSQCLRQSPDVEAALQAFEKMRRVKVDQVVNTSWQIGRLAHHPIGQPLMKTMIKLTPSSVVARQLARLYTVEGLT